MTKHTQTDAHEFKIRCQSLADRVGITLTGASKIRRRFCSLGILKQTKPYVPNKFCARFKWLANHESVNRSKAIDSDKGVSRWKR